MLSFLKDNVDRPVTLAQAGAAVRRSAAAVRKRILQETGLTFRAYLSRLRMEEAKRLLVQTRGKVGDIASAIGFGQSRGFSTAFRRATGYSPRRYRDEHQEPLPTDAPGERLPEPSLVFRAAFSPDELRSRWKPRAGTWEVREGRLCGTAERELVLLLDVDLPPGFLLRFQAMKTTPPPDGTVRRLALTLSNGSNRQSYSIRFGDTAAPTHSLWREGRVMVDEGGELRVDRWHEVAVTLYGDLVSVRLDDAEIIRYRELLPVAYRNRSRLAFESWDSTLLVRGLELLSLPSQARPVGSVLADELAAQGDMERALDLYESELDRRRGTAAETDLLLKVGMSYLGLGFSVRARSYLDRFVERRRGSLWGTVAAIASFETRADRLDDAALQAEAETLVRAAGSSTQRLHACTALEEMGRHVQANGDFERAFVLFRLRFAAAEPFSLHAYQSAELVASALLASYRYADLLRLAAAPDTRARLDTRQQNRMRATAVLALIALHRDREAEGWIRALTRSKDRSPASQADLRSVVLFQSRDEPRRALDLALAVASRPESLRPTVETAVWSASQLLALSGETARAHKILAALPPPPTDLTLYVQMHFRWTLHAIERDYEEILTPLSERLSGRPAADPIALRERLLLAILQELTGEPTKAVRNLEILEKTFRDTDSWRWVLPASFLLGRIPPENLWKNVRRFDLFQDAGSSSLFYMLGLVLRSRGDEASARELFRLAVESDPFNYWAAIFARRELGLLSKSLRSFLA